MIQGLNNLPDIGRIGGVGQSSSISGAPSPTAASFSDLLKKSIDEVSRLQQDATAAVNDVATGKSEDVTGVMTAVQKADMAFKTLVAIRAKLMDAYDEIKGISI
ncbi:MAG: flagellar hook-basal body complex protein FliE [Planctomycetota bacterium]|nr:flagellar hook-basal body complex protein FliE [Planctomycetota bacterium]